MSVDSKLNSTRPREAAVAIVNYVNHRNVNVSLLALVVRCVGSRGYRLRAED